MKIVVRKKNEGRISMGARDKRGNMILCSRVYKICKCN